MTIACFMFVVSMGTTLRRFTDLQQLPGRTRATAAAVNRQERLVFSVRFSDKHRSALTERWFCLKNQNCKPKSSHISAKDQPRNKIPQSQSVA
jgi:hypothetical protein